VRLHDHPVSWPGSQSQHHSFGIDGSNTHALGFRVQGGEHAVPHYFFHIKHGQVTILDQEGIELDNPAQAEVEAAYRVQKIVTDQALNGPVGRRDSGSMIIVADENWCWLYEFPF
jgi:hypothetical protein